MTGLPDGGLNQRFDLPTAGTDTQHVTILDQGNRAAGLRLRADMDGGWHLAACAGHATIREQRHAIALVLQDCQSGRQAMQFGHAVCIRSLKTDHHNDITVQLACLESGDDIFLTMKHCSRCLDGLAVIIDGTRLVNATAKTALNQTHPAILTERLACIAQHAAIG